MHFQPPSVNFINVKCAHFSNERLFSSYVLALNELMYEKFARSTLMKWTAIVASSVIFSLNAANELFFRQKVVRLCI